MRFGWVLPPRLPESIWQSQVVQDGCAQFPQILRNSRKNAIPAPRFLQNFFKHNQIQFVGSLGKAPLASLAGANSVTRAFSASSVIPRTSPRMEQFSIQARLMASALPTSAGGWMGCGSGC